jgi:hypothetical protein
MTLDPGLRRDDGLGSFRGTLDSRFREVDLSGILRQFKLKS